jgi:surface antigen
MAYGPQCTDLVNDYLWRVWHAGPLGGNAIDFQHAHLQGWKWTANTPDNRPHTGAIVVWDGPNATLGLTIFGHTAVVLLSDVRALQTVDQNWPPGHAVQPIFHSYTSVAGWWSPPSAVLDRS